MYFFKMLFGVSLFPYFRTVMMMTSTLPCSPEDPYFGTVMTSTLHSSPHICRLEELFQWCPQSSLLFRLLRVSTSITDILQSFTHRPFQFWLFHWALSSFSCWHSRQRVRNVCTDSENSAVETQGTKLSRPKSQRPLFPPRLSVSLLCLQCLSSPLWRPRLLT